MYELSDLLLVHTDSLKKEILGSFPLSPEKIRVVPHGYFEYPKSRFSQEHLKRIYGLPGDKRVLLFFGSIRENKGLDILLQALKGLEHDYFLLIAGEIAGASENSSAYYKKLMEILEIQDRVLWIKKYIPEEEIPGIFEVSEAIVLPYKKTFHAQSGVLNLAIGYEKPCVVTDVGGIGETVREYNLGIVVKPEDVEALKKALQLYSRMKNILVLIAAKRIIAGKRFVRSSSGFTRSFS